jgi:hypothetical protein
LVIKSTWVAADPVSNPGCYSLASDGVMTTSAGADEPLVGVNVLARMLQGMSPEEINEFAARMQKATQE